jgi:RimJ/RimL family protein N-acetyltransferase
MTEERLGRALPGWSAPPRPGREVLQGRRLRLEPLSADDHAYGLFAAFQGRESLWDYMAYGPFASASAYHRWAREREAGEDPRFLVLCDSATGQPGGIAAYLRIAPEAGSIEVGHICIAPALQDTAAMTEAMFLMMDWAFRAGYRRYEWKCDALNVPSRRAAQRLGFSFEGIFRQHLVVKGRNRDTAWFSVIDDEWPALAEAYRVWLDPANFDAAGRQRERLSELTALVRQSSDPGLAPGRG